MKPEELDFLKLLFTSAAGRTYNIEVGGDRIEEAIEEGVFFDGSSVEGYASVNSSDLHIRPTGREPIVLPWTPNVAVMPCSVFDKNGEPHGNDPRNVLRKVASELAKNEKALVVGSELEFFLVHKTAHKVITPADTGGYFATVPSDGGLGFRRRAFKTLEEMGISATTHHHEVAPGQHEIGLSHREATIAADNIMLSKLALTELSMESGSVATFMPKPFGGVNGSGMHLHLSIWDIGESRNLFASNESGSISALAEHFVAGILEHAEALAAIVAPTINSYKRLTPGFEAPTIIAWGPMNRTTMIRVPLYNGSSSKARIEFRCPDPSCNPHLALAAVLAAGMDGIRKELDPPAPTTADLYHSTDDLRTLPGSLVDAVDRLEKDLILRAALGWKLVETIVSLRTKEWEAYDAATKGRDTSSVTDWEIAEYLLLN